MKNSLSAAAGTLDAIQPKYSMLDRVAEKEAHVSDNVGAGRPEIEAEDLSRIRQDVEPWGVPAA